MKVDENDSLSISGSLEMLEKESAAGKDLWPTPRLPLKVQKAPGGSARIQVFVLTYFECNVAFN